MFHPTEMIEQNKEQILQTYRELHLLAEPSWKEKRTSAYLHEKLNDAGFQVKTFIGHYGLVAEIQGKSNKVIALRADLDALVQEVDGVVCANHSCGHDAHSSMVFHTALTLGKQSEPPNHTIRFIFQPAEEKAEGALQMMEDGVLDEVAFLCGIHLRPVGEIPFGKAAPVIQHGSTSCLKGSIKGMSAHAARPEEGNNPIEAASLLIQAVQRIQLPENDGASIKMTELHSGEATNLIPETARFSFDLRSRSNDAMRSIVEQARDTFQEVAKMTETRIEAELVEHSPAATVNETAVALAQKAIMSVLGEANVVPVCQSPGAEDFHYYTMKHPDINATMIGLGCDLKPGLHHPKMTFSQEALIYGTKILTQLMLEADAKQW